MATPGREARRLVESARFHLDDRGLRYVATDAVDLARSYVAYPLRAHRRRIRGFSLGGSSYPYFVHHYNRAWRNERTVELALASDFMERRRESRLLEIGNVVQHYGVRGHDVLDKYEVAPGVINEDVVSFKPAERYESILSLSTLEHVGWDERPRDPDKTLRACENILRMLAPGGHLLLTAPIGQNSYLDAFIADEALPFDDVRFLRRLNSGNDWAEAAWTDVAGSRYGTPFRNANALLVARTTAAVV